MDGQVLTIEAARQIAEMACGYAIGVGAIAGAVAAVVCLAGAGAGNAIAGCITAWLDRRGSQRAIDPM